MIKHTFFTVLLCFLLSFSIFTVDVYASSSGSLYYFVPIPTLGSYNAAGQRTVTIHPTVNFVSLQNSRYYASSTYSFEESFFIMPYLNRSGTFPDFSYSGFISPGVYSFAFPLRYTVSPFSSSGYRFPSTDYQVSVTVTDVPDGLDVVLASHPTYIPSSGVYQLDFWLVGSCYFAPILASSPSIALRFDFIYSTIASQSLLSDFYSYDTYVLDLDIFGGMNGGYSRVPFTFVSPNASTDSILGSVNDSINDVNDTIKQEHQEEIDKADQATSDVTGGVGQLTGTLSSWEIITMPFNLVKNFAQAIAGDGSSAFTFPSFSMMGYQIWPSYTFDLQTVASNFPVLYNGLHLVSGTVVVTGFVRYLWRKWALLVGDDMPEGSDTS